MDESPTLQEKNSKYRVFNEQHEIGDFPFSSLILILYQDTTENNMMEYE